MLIPRPTGLLYSPGMLNSQVVSFDTYAKSISGYTCYKSIKFLKSFALVYADYHVFGEVLTSKFLNTIIGKINELVAYDNMTTTTLTTISPLTTTSSTTTATSTTTTISGSTITNNFDSISSIIQQQAPYLVNAACVDNNFSSGLSNNPISQDDISSYIEKQTAFNNQFYNLAKALAIAYPYGLTFEGTNEKDIDFSKLTEKSLNTCFGSFEVNMTDEQYIFYTQNEYCYCDNYYQYYKLNKNPIWSPQGDLMESYYYDAGGYKENLQPYFQNWMNMYMSLAKNTTTNVVSADNFKTAFGVDPN
jgi:uncharacterized protein YozE (UPF0346 family)